MSWRFLVFLLLIWRFFKPFYSVSIVNFEKVNISWEIFRLVQISFIKKNVKSIIIST